MSESITIILKFIDETRRTIQVSSNQTIRDVIHTHITLGPNQIVNLIFRGRILNERDTIEESSLTDQSTIHCFITDAPSNNASLDRSEDSFDLGKMFLPLMGLLLIVAWIARVHYNRFFNAMSTVFLTILSLVYTLGLSRLTMRQ